MNPTNKIIKKEKQKEKKMKNIELNDISINLDNKDNPLMNDEKNNIINDDIEFNDIEKEIDKNFKKMTFAQFFLNNFYCKKCTKYNAQEIIRICNEIMTNYLSVESILYNQIMLENLFKDYKWNNDELNDIGNNKLIINLNKHL